MHHPVARLCLAALVAAVALLPFLPTRADTPATVLKAESERVAAVAKVRPAVVAVFSPGGAGGGSGVLVTKDGYALTNFHVTQGAGPVMQCGLADGVLYDAVLVGQDKVGDVALIKLLPRPKTDKGPGVHEGQDFPTAPLGDSDKLKEGDWSMAMGNPFLLATDFTPTVTFGLISGVHRYQYPAGTLLEYTDCIQIDTSINPGNSGGPLFNIKGELVGINGRGSFDKRGRVNSGVGYAISINQIKNFLGHLRGGLDADHASLGATVITPEGAALGTLQVNQILENSDVARRGLLLEDEIVSFDGRPMANTNHLKNILGLYPRGWRMPMEYRRAGVKKEILVRLMGIQARELEGGDQPKPPPPPGGQPGKKPFKSPASAFYKPKLKEGFANYYFNEVERDRLLAEFRKLGDFRKQTGEWKIKGTVRLGKLSSEGKVDMDIKEEKVGASLRPVVRLKINTFPYELEPLKERQSDADLKIPEGSGGFLLAMYMYRQLLTAEAKGFDKCFYGGYEPVYIPPQDGRMPANLKALRVDAEVLNASSVFYTAKWFFSKDDHKLLAAEIRVSEDDDPCEVYFSDYRPVDGRSLPHRIQVRFGDSHYGTVSVTNFRTPAK
jgi:S1-C subfamily serine protease